MKRGQITIFIIVGIVILLAIGLGVVAWKIINEQKPSEDQNKIEVNVALKPLQTYIEACLESTARQALVQTALHGGYYAPEEQGVVSIPGRPTESRALEAFPGEVIPYWSYLASPNTCTDCLVSTEQPPLTGERYPAVEYQVERAIERNLNTCLKDFSMFKADFAIERKSEPAVSVAFGQSDTKVTLTYLLDVTTQAESKSSLKTYTVRVDMPFKKLYDYADEIRRTIDYQPQPFFAGLSLELITLEAIGPDDHEPIPPPFGGTKFSRYPGPFWTLSQTRDIVKASLESNINNVQLLGGRNMDFVNTSDSLINNYYANYYFSIANPDSDIETRFVYLADWEPYLAVHPGGQLIKPDLSSSGFPFIPSLKKKVFQYDLSYPVLVQIRQPSQNGEEFLFQFPFEVNLRNNNPLDYSDLIVQEPDYSFCDPALATGSQVNISVVDQSSEGVSADVRYSCLDSSCGLGTALGGRLTNLQLPSCIGGEFIAERDGYKDGRLSFDSADGKNSEPQIVMQKKTSVTIKAKGKFIQRVAQYSDETGGFGYTWQLADNSFDVDVPQSLLLVLTPRDDAEGAHVLLWPDTEGLGHTPSMYPGLYDVTAVIMEQTVEPKIVKGSEICAGGVLGVGDTCTTIPDITLGGGKYKDENGVEQDESTAIYVGGVDWNEQTKNITITQEMLDSGVLTITVPVVYLPDVQMITEDRNDLEAFDQVSTLGNQLDIS